MKKISLLMMAMAISALTFTACEDVPEPYPTPTPTNNGENKGQDEGTATGDGTLANPFNSVAAAKAAKELGSGNVSEQMYYIKGKVVSIATDKNGNVLNFDQGTYGNASFYISDDGTETGQFYCYRILYLGNKKWTNGAGDILKVGDEVIVCAKITLYNTTPETQQNEGFLYSLNGKTEGGGSEETGVATGDGTLANPFNSVAATNEAKKLSSGAVSDKAYYIKGKVVSIATDKNGNILNFDQGTFGNATFYISDDGTETGQFYCYRVLYLGNKKWTEGAGDILVVGDEVIVCAKLTMYNTTPETQQNEGYLYSLNGKTESSDTPTPQPGDDLGTADSPITVDKALEIINGYENAGESTTDAYVKGKIVSVQSYNEKYKSITYYISDDGTEANQLQVYSGKGLNGADFASKDDLQTGSVVVVKGKLKKYAAKDGTITPEINQSSTIISIDGNSGGGGDNPGGGGEVSGNTLTVAVSSFGLENQAKLTSLTLSDGTTLTFDGGGNNNVPAYYTAGNGTIRMYPKNSLVINAGNKKISSIEIVCNEYNGTLYNASGNISAGGSKMTIDGTSLKSSNINASSISVINEAEGSGAATQLRMEKLTITYAE